MKVPPEAAQQDFGVMYQAKFIGSNDDWNTDLTKSICLDIKGTLDTDTRRKGVMYDMILSFILPV